MARLLWLAGLQPSEYGRLTPGETTALLERIERWHGEQVEAEHAMWKGQLDVAVQSAGHVAEAVVRAVLALATAMRTRGS